MQVKDIMSNKLAFVHLDDKLIEVANLLTQSKLRGVPVIDDNKKIVGIITETDFFYKSLPGLCLPTYINILGGNKFGNDMDKEQKENIDVLLKATAKDIMTKKCFTVPVNTEANILIEIFKEKKFYTIPVVNDENKLVGIVTVADIIKLF